MKKLALIMISFLFLLSMPAWAGGIRVSRADLIAREQKLVAEEKELRAKAYELRANGDDYSVYKKKGLTLLGLDHKRYRKNRLYKRVWQIELNKKSSFTMFGVKVGDTVKSAMVRLFLGGCTDLSDDSWSLSAKAPGGDLFSANVRNGVITSLKLERRY